MFSCLVASVNIWPAVQFWGRRKNQIADLVADHKPHHPPILLDLAWALAPFLKRHWPQLNDQGILDDAVETLQKMFDES